MAFTPKFLLFKSKRNYRFYRCSGWLEREATPLPGGYEISVWWPGGTGMWPREVDGLKPRARFAFRWLLDRAHLFATREVGAICIHYANRLVHYSGFTPRYWRFPFMDARDLQIGDTWTDPAHRAKGLASFALNEIIAMKREPGRGFWYVVGDDNVASIRVVEKHRFALIGLGRWRKPLGIKLLGSYVPDDAGVVMREEAKETS